MSKIAVIDDSATIVTILSDLLTKAGYDVFGLSDATDAFDRLVLFSPDLIILDVVMPAMNGYDLCRIIRNDTRTAHLPVVMLTSRGDVNDKVEGLEAGADDYIVKPFEPAEVLARVKTHLRRAKQHKCFSPLTGLPGNMIIEEEIKKCLTRPDFSVAILYLDVDNFKAYNDNYGFVRGDELLRTISNILRDSVQRISPLNSFVGHIGGDDFIALVPAEVMHDVCQAVISEITAATPQFYSPKDQMQGYVVAQDRFGEVKKFPLITVSISVITNQVHNLTDISQLGELAARLKKKAKEVPGSVYIVNE